MLGYYLNMSMPVKRPTEATAAEIQPYQIHVSNKYLELTRKKLELTRLPREALEPTSNEWWEPKSTVETLIDYWLEEFSWETEASEINRSVPQFRTALQLPPTGQTCRIHFIHAKTIQKDAVSVLLIPPFPFTNLSLKHIIDSFVNQRGSEAGQLFHLVIPSLPGTGFSDALPNNVDIVSATATLFNSLMQQLGYHQYIVSNGGAGTYTPFDIDWKVADSIATNFAGTCCGAHFISPSLLPPTFRDAPLDWMKWKLAKLFGGGLFGYKSEDFAALQRLPSLSTSTSSNVWPLCGPYHKSTTLAYALCDSPTGLLVYTMMMLRILSPRKTFNTSDIITTTLLTWLPGPEAGIRVWAHCAAQRLRSSPIQVRRPPIAMTTFLGDIEPTGSGPRLEHGATVHPRGNYYACPAWANRKYEVVSATRLPGQPGLLIWERPEIILDGIRGLCMRVKMPKTPRISRGELVPLQAVTVGQGEGT